MRKRLGQGIFPDRTTENTNRRDADLDGGQEAGRLVIELQRRSGTGAAIVGQALQTGLARGNDSDFRHGQNAIQENQEDEQKDVHRAIMYLRKPAINPLCF